MPTPIEQKRPSGRTVGGFEPPSAVTARLLESRSAIGLAGDLGVHRSRVYQILDGGAVSLPLYARLLRLDGQDGWAETVESLAEVVGC